MIVFTGGGTAGHVIPGLSVLRTVASRTDGSFVWIGSKRGIEKEIVENADIPFYGIPSGKLRRYFSLENIIDIVRICSGVVKAFFLLVKLKPAAVFSKGGYVSVPVVFAARVLGIYTATHESDVDPGLATKINSRFVNTVFVSFERTADYFPAAMREKVVVSGNPVRKIMEQGSREKAKKLLSFPGDKPVVLVLGGSLGASQINTLVLGCKEKLSEACFIIHQMGKNGFTPINEEAYRSFDFIGDELADFFALADIVLSRAGANTLWEIGRLGKPSVLVPLAGAATRGDQVRNALYFRQNGAAIVLNGDKVTADNLYRSIMELLGDNEKRRSMGAAAAALCSEDANEIISRVIMDEAVRNKVNRGP